jgi:hypothetical protein
MKIKSKVLIALLFLGLGACGESSDLGNGFRLVDQGGSKHSLAKDGFLLINVVTGVGKVGGYTIVESREYYSRTCDYHLIDHDKGELVRLAELSPGRGITAKQAAQSIKAISSRSCKSEGRMGRL